MQEAPVFLSLGSNQGDREFFLSRAREEIATIAGKILSVSSVYETEAWGNDELQPFLNQALEIETDLAPEVLLKALLEIEQSLGRERTDIPWQARTIDIDILFYGKLDLKTPALLLPHPFIQDRKFVLMPLAEIAGNWTHPRFGKTIQELLESCPDSLGIRKTG
ncbi:MAG: 2-amino-4-hydroxy-6-hydroxymethyldihydropteridine diphosphokinase [Bacteroidia bacterium]